MSLVTNASSAALASRCESNPKGACPAGLPSHSGAGVAAVRPLDGYAVRSKAIRDDGLQNRVEPPAAPPASWLQRKVDCYAAG